MVKEKGSMVILGSTGSVGEQAIDVARKEGIRVSALSAHSNVKRVEEQAREFGVDYCAMADEEAAKELKIKLADTNIRVFSGSNGICDMIALADGDVAVNSIIGQAGLEPTLAVIESGKRLALANKESLVVAGDIVMMLAFLALCPAVGASAPALSNGYSSVELRQVVRFRSTQGTDVAV